MPRSFRFAVMSSAAPDARTWRERARRIEELGYSTLFMPDHFDDQWAPLVSLTVALEATERLVVGSLVLDNDYRHPVVLAKEAATLDLVAEGRFELGLGAGWKRTDYDSSGIPYDPPGERVSRMQEALTVMKQLWSTPDPVTFKGEHYSIDSAVGTPRPHTKPHPKICIGGGSRRVLSIAAAEADIIGVNASLAEGDIGPGAVASSTAVAFDEKIRWIRDASGGRFGQIELQCHTAAVMIIPNRREMAERLAPSLGVTPEEALEVPLVLAGTVDEICESLVERRERHGLSYWVVPDSVIDDFAPVVERLSGT